MSIVALVHGRGPMRYGEKSERVKAAQRALICAGHQLVVDGDFGAITEDAVRRFQAAHGLTVDGVVGPGETAPALDGVAAAAAAPPPEPALPSSRDMAPWLSTMRAITGTREVPGAADNPLIVGWRDAIAAAFPACAAGVAGYIHDSIPWCGLTVAYCMAAAGQMPPVAPLYATNWFYQWSKGVRLDGPALGAVLVKTRHGGGHVTLYEGEDDSYFYCRGGNQSDMVNVTRIAKIGGGVLGFMWPKDFPRPRTGAVRTTFANARAGSEA